tara:strand:- start:293 stop:682 length:390 start_codon:yes stop_codon:yes gene_type:complete
MIEHVIYKGPQKLTPNQKRWSKRYIKKSGTDFIFEPPEEYHEVCEWENGWIDFTVDKDYNVLFIHSMYCNKPDTNLAMIETFKLAVDLAKQRNCNAIEWDTRRPFRAWKRLAKNIGNVKIITRQLRIEI